MKGVYCLLLRLKEDCTIPVGALGPTIFKAGYYTYIGSALSSIENRVKRHLRKRKRFRWHIDYLLGSPQAQVRGLGYIETKRRLECQFSKRIMHPSKFSQKKFGSSDCKCLSHLHFFDSYSSAVSAIKASGLRWLESAKPFSA